MYSLVALSRYSQRLTMMLSPATDTDTMQHVLEPKTLPTQANVHQVLWHTRKYVQTTLTDRPLHFAVQAALETAADVSGTAATRGHFARSVHRRCRGVHRVEHNLARASGDGVRARRCTPRVRHLQRLARLLGKVLPRAIAAHEGPVLPHRRLCRPSTPTSTQAPLARSDGARGGVRRAHGVVDRHGPV